VGEQAEFEIRVNRPMSRQRLARSEMRVFIFIK